MSAPWIEARYRGRCNCGALFERGAVIRYDGRKRPHQRITGCPTCNPNEAKQGPSDRAPDPVDAAYEDQCAARCGLTGGSD